MSLQNRFSSLISAIGADVKDLRTNYASKSYISGLPGINTISTVKTGAFTAAPGVFYPITLSAGVGEITVTLPTAPYAGATVMFSRSDPNIYTSGIKLLRSGTDTIDGDVAIYLYGAGTTVTLTYVNGNWYVTANGSRGYSLIGPPSPGSAFPPTVMSRDNSGRSQVAAPAVALDIANKAYVDSVSDPLLSKKMYEEYSAPNQAMASGWNQIKSMSSTAQQGAGANQRWAGLSYGTVPYDGVYSFGFSAWIVTNVAGAGRLLGGYFIGSSTPGSGTGLCRTETDANAAGSSTYGYPTISVMSKKYLTAGTTLQACVYATGAFIATYAIGTVWFNLDQAY